MEEYFQKWCCLILYAENAESWNIYKDGLEKIRRQINCNVHIYLNRKLQQPAGLSGAKIETTDDNPGFSRFFKAAFASGYRKVIMPLNGYLPSEEILKEAFSALKMIEFCLGPGSSGNTYLVGMNYFEAQLIDPLSMNQPVRFRELVKTVGNLKLPIYKLPLRNDIPSHEL